MSCGSKKPVYHQGTCGGILPGWEKRVVRSRSDVPGPVPTGGQTDVHAVDDLCVGFNEAANSTLSAPLLVGKYLTLWLAIANLTLSALTMSLNRTYRFSTISAVYALAGHVFSGYPAYDTAIH